MNDNASSDNTLQKISNRQRSRNLTVFLVLLAFVVLIFAVTIVKIRMGYGA